MHRSNKVSFKGTLTSKAFSIFLALTLCVPTTLAGNLSHVRQVQADTSVPQEQSKGGDALDSAPDGDSVGEAADSAQAQDAPDSPALSPALDWSTQYQALVLSSKGLTVDVQKLVESVRESGATLSSGDTQAQAAQSGESHPVDSQAAAPSGAAQSELPSTIPATLDLSFELDPSAWVGDSGANPSSGADQASATASLSASEHKAVVPGDWFSVELPKELKPADETLALDVFQNDEQGNATTVKIAEAKWGDKAKVTFTTPVDTASGAAPLNDESADQATGADVSMPLTLAASVQLPVVFSADLVQDAPSTLNWLLRQTATESRSAELNVPSKGDLLSLMGAAPSEGQPNKTTEDVIVGIHPSSKREGSASFCHPVG